MSAWTRMISGCVGASEHQGSALKSGLGVPVATWDLLSFGCETTLLHMETNGYS